MIIVFGSLNMDLVMTLESLPRPGETVLCPGYVLKPGGKGANQAVAARRAGAEVAMAGCLGDDAFGAELWAVLAREGIDTRALTTVDRPTGCAAIRVDAAGENSISVASGANLSTSAGQVGEALLGPGTTVLAQMEVPPAETWEMLRRARAAGARTVLNLAPAGEVPPETLRDIDVLVVNELELASVADRLGLAGGQVEERAAALARGFGTVVVVTLGAAGAVALEPDGRGWRVPALSIRPVDTTGAGDAFCGVLTAGLDAGLALPAALARASVGAALACLALGAQESLPQAAAIDRELSQLTSPTPLT